MICTASSAQPPHSPFALSATARPASARTPSAACVSAKAYLYRQQFPTRGDKGARAQSIRARMATNSWYEPFRSELLPSQRVRHEDQVDALGLIGQLLDKMIPARRIVKPKPKSDPGYYVLPENEIDRYARGGSAGVDWSPLREDPLGHRPRHQLERDLTASATGKQLVMK
jgi:hypothetical protein